MDAPNYLSIVPGDALDLFLELHHGLLVLLLEGEDDGLRLHVGVLQELPQLGHLGLALPVDVQLALGAALGLSQTLGQGDDLHLGVKMICTLIIMTRSQQRSFMRLFLLPGAPAFPSRSSA